MKRLAILLLVAGCSPTPSLTDQKVRADLIGHDVPESGCGWRFNDPNEIKSLAIGSVEKSGGVTVAHVDTDLEDARSHRPFKVKLRLSYRQDSDNLNLVAIAVDQWEPACGFDLKDGGLNLHRH